MYQSFMQTKLKCGAEKIQTQVSSTDLNGCVACKKKKKGRIWETTDLYKCIITLKAY